jgi:hypothetical protein
LASGLSALVVCPEGAVDSDFWGARGVSFVQAHKFAIIITIPITETASIDFIEKIFFVIIYSSISNAYAVFVCVLLVPRADQRLFL